MSQMRAKGTLLNMGGSQEQGSEIQDKFFLICELASNVNRRASTCEHGSPCSCSEHILPFHPFLLQPMAEQEIQTIAGNA